MRYDYSEVINLTKYELYVKCPESDEHVHIAKSSKPLQVKMNHERNDDYIKTYRVTESFLQDATQSLAIAKHAGYKAVVLTDATAYELRLNLGDTALLDLGVDILTFRCYSLNKGVVEASYLADCVNTFVWHI